MKMQTYIQTKIMKDGDLTYTALLKGLLLAVNSATWRQRTFVKEGETVENIVQTGALWVLIRGIMLFFVSIWMVFTSLLSFIALFVVYQVLPLIAITMMIRARLRAKKYLKDLQVAVDAAQERARNDR